MKKIRIVVLILFLGLMAGCSSGSSSSSGGGGATIDSAVVGTWKLSTDSSNTITFKNDGTYTVTSASCTVSGTWSASGGNITTTQTSGSCMTTGATTPYTVTSTTFTVQHSNGSTEVWVKS
ncbi:MAG: hypothetical protein HZA00_03550 [Nitrospinae bacterium]|nr:hypothetical protein [Nitrospinota bacterium]